MALVTTPGAENADSYFTLDEANAYFSGRGITAWTGIDAVKENAARRGTSYLDNQYRGRWKGYRTEQAQSLAWPRIGSGGDSRLRAQGETFAVYGIVDEDGFEIPTNVVPQQIKTAAMEAALLALTGVNMEPRLERGGQIKSIGKGVGPLRKDITYMDGAPAVDRFLAIEGLLRGLVNSTPGATSGNVRLVRS